MREQYNEMYVLRAPVRGVIDRLADRPFSVGSVASSHQPASQHPQQRTRSHTSLSVTRRKNNNSNNNSHVLQRHGQRGEHTNLQRHSADERSRAT
jgi:hypothetical protein